MIIRIMGEGQFLIDDSDVEELSERIAELEAAVQLYDEAGFKLAHAELLGWVRSTGSVVRVKPGALEISDVPLPSEKEATLYDGSSARVAVAVYGKLAAADPDRYRPSLAASLDNLGVWLFRLGRPYDFVPAKEAVALYRDLAAADPDRYRPGLAASLHHLGAQLFARDRPDDALRATGEAVALYRDLAVADPDRYRPGLAASLRDLGVWLFTLGRPDDALPATEEAAALYRDLAAARPDVRDYHRDLAASLNSLGALLFAQGRPADALPVTKQAVALYEGLAGNDPTDPQRDLTASLDNLAAQLHALDRPDDAAQVFEQAAVLHEAQASAEAEQRANMGEGLAAQAPGAGGPPRAQQSVAYDDLVSSAFAELVQPGRLLFNPPDRMQLGHTERVEVRLTRTLTLDAELLKDLRGHGEPQLEEISTSPLMAVALNGDGFRITPYSDEEQSVIQDGITTWEFDICALKRGQQRLVLSVSLRVPVAGQPLERKSIPVREATIDVQVGAPVLIGHFVSANWQWFVGTAIAIAAVLVAVLH